MVSRPKYGDKSSTSLWALASELGRFLSKENRMGFLCLWGASTGYALFELFAVGGIAFFASALMNSEALLSSSMFQSISQFLFAGATIDKHALIISTGIISIVLIILKNTLFSLLTYANSYLTVKLETEIGQQMMNGILNMPFQWLLNQNTGDLQYVVSQRAAMGRNFILPVLDLLRDATTSFIMLMGLVLIDPLVSLFALLLLSASGLTIYRRTRSLIDHTARITFELRRDMFQDSTVALHGIKDILILNRKKRFVDCFTSKTKPLSRHAAKQAVLGILPAMLLECVGVTMIFLAVTLMLYSLNYSQAKTSTLIALLALVGWRLLPAISRILANFTRMRDSRPVLEYLLDYLKILRQGMPQPEGPAMAPRPGFAFQRELAFENVGFQYDMAKQKTLKDITLNVPKGKSLGVIGRSGAGKSTLLDLLIGLLKPTSGRILLDGQLLEGDLALAWRTQFGYVPQHAYIADASLAENVAFGIEPERIDEDRVRECCRLAAIDFLDELPDDIHSCIGERGIRLSGGQRQRIAIARALYHDPKVLIFDEATSSLDSANEQAILDTIYGFKERYTLVMIAHRLTTVEQCDRLVWIKDGVIVRTGSPDEVLPDYASSQFNGSNGHDAD